MAAALLPFWRERGHHAEAQRRCLPLLEHPANQQPSHDRARVRTALCALANERNQTQLIRPLATAVLADARVLGIPTLESMGHIWLAHADLADGDPAAAAGQYRLALAILRPLDEPARVAETLTNLSCMLIEQRAVDEATPLLAEALALYRAAENVWGQGFVHSTLGEAAWAAGDFAAALASAQQGLIFHRQLQHQHRSSYSLLQCGQVLLRLGRHEEARSHLAEGLAITLAHGFHEQTTIALVQSAQLAAAAGQPRRAAQMLGAAQANIDRGGALVGRHDDAEFARAQQHAQAKLPVADWQAGWEAGLALTLREAAAMAFVEHRGRVAGPARGCAPACGQAEFKRCSGRAAGHQALLRRRAQQMRDTVAGDGLADQRALERGQRDHRRALRQRQQRGLHEGRVQAHRQQRQRQMAGAQGMRPLQGGSTGASAHAA